MAPGTTIHPPTPSWVCGPTIPAEGSDNESGKSRTFLVDLARGSYREVITEPAPPYYGMSFKVFYDRRHDVTLVVVGDEVWSFKAPSLAAARPSEMMAP